LIFEGTIHRPMTKHPRLRLMASLAGVLLTGACATHRSGTMRPEPPPAAALAPMPEAVTSFGAVANDGWLYVCGGHKGERHEYSAPMVSGAFHRLRLSDGTVWETLAPAEPAQGAPLAAYGGFIYRVGGMAARNAPGEKSDLHSRASVARYDIGRGVWEEHVAMPEARSSHDAVVLGRTLYVAGGWTLAGATSKAVWRDTLLALDLGGADPRWREIPQPFRRRALAVAGAGDRLYCMGGMDAEGNTSLAVDVYDARTGEWSKGPELPPGPMKGFGASAIAQGGRVYYSGMKGELRRLDNEAGVWSLVGNLGHPRFFHRLVPAGTGHLVVAGGEDSEGKRRDLEVMSLPVVP